MTHEHLHLDRRTFLRAAGAVSISAVSVGAGSIGGVRVRDLGPTSSLGRTLVLVQLSGGNDGLSTIVPYANDELPRVRTSTLHDPKKLHPIDDEIAFQPKLVGMRAAFDEGRVAIVQGAGYPDPVRSHFKSMEVWHTGRRAGRGSGDGWIGRLAASSWDGADRPDSVVHFGGRAPYSLYSVTDPPIALASPTGYRWFGDSEVYAMGGNAITELCEQAEEPDDRHVGRDRALQALRTTLDDANESSHRMREAAASYETEVEYPRDALSASLRDVAALIANDPSTRVFSVRAGGYDTHTNQLVRHDRNMATLDGALTAFLNDVRRHEAGKDVLVLVFSEFGRRVAENGSKGHDHGKAGPVFLLGERVKGGVYGEHPSLTELDDGDLAFTTDFRAIYGTVLDRWFGVPHAEILGAEYPTLGVV